MFRGGAVNPYDDIVVKATDENQTSENWEILLNLCDKVQEEGEQGARNVIAALLKRLTHRNANVQLYALSVAEALSKNCDTTVHREMASKAFTQGLEKLATDRNGHEKVKKRTLALIKLWAGEFAHDPQLGLMEECYTSLKAKGMRFDDIVDNPAPTYDDEAARREEEELQRVLEMSKVDKGGRERWNEYTSYGAGGSGGSGSGSKPGGSNAPGYAPPGPAYTPSAVPAAASSSRQQTAPTPAPVPVPVPAAAAPVMPVQGPAPAATPSYTPAPNTASPVAEPTPLDPSTLQIVKRVRALHDFSATEVGELSFKKGDVIKVVDRCFKDWWRGQIKGRTGIFPVNYVEPLPEPTAAELAKEAETEALVFSQGGAIDTLLQKLREFDPATENLNDNEEIQELYRSSMSLRPKILKLIDKYSQKKAELVVMNERYVKARNTFERMMEESVAKHNPSAAVYDYSQPPVGPDPYGQPGNRATGYGWNPNLYGQGAGAVQSPQDAAAYAAYQQQQQQAQPQPAPVTTVPQEYPPQPYGQPVYPPHDPYAQQQYAYPGYQQPGQEQQGQPGQYPQQQQPGAPVQQPHQHGQPQQPQPQPQQYQQPQPSQPQLQQAYSYGAEPKSPGQQPNPVEQVPQQQPQPYGPPPDAHQGYAQPHDPQQAYAQPHDVQAQVPQGYGQPVEGQPGYQPLAQPHVQGQPQGQPEQQPHGYQLTDPNQQSQPQPQQPQAVDQQPQQQPQPHEQHQVQPQEGAQTHPAADTGPPYLWNGTANYPNPGACQWAEYYLGGGDDLSGLVYFTGPDGNVLTSVPPRGAPVGDQGHGAQMQAMQQGFAGVELGDGQPQRA